MNELTGPKETLKDEHDLWSLGFASRVALWEETGVPNERKTRSRQEIQYRGRNRFLVEKILTKNCDDSQINKWKQPESDIWLNTCLILPFPSIQHQALNSNLSLNIFSVIIEILLHLNLFFFICFIFPTVTGSKLRLTRSHSKFHLSLFEWLNSGKTLVSFA